MVDIPLGSPWSSLRKRVSKYPAATSEANICHSFILVSSWQIHSVGNGGTELQYLNCLMNFKTENKDILAESYMKQQNPKKVPTLKTSAWAVKKQDTSSFPKQRSMCCPQSSTPDLSVIYSVVTLCPWKSKYCHFVTYFKK